MANETRYFFVKFKMDDKLNSFEDLIISEDENRIAAWSGTTVEDSDKKNTESTKSQTTKTFADVAKEYEEIINTFQRTVPFIMQTAPIMRKLMDDRKIRPFLKANGERLENGRYEVYKVEVSHYAELNRVFEESTSIASGLSNLPNLFLVGLVSAYDVFLSNLIRVLFLSKPQLISSSDRNISFRDLVEIGSIETARERIIDKEIESIIRDSHVKQIKWLEEKLGIPLTKDLSIWPEFIEICERRNLLTHTGGVVSSQYLDVCREQGGRCDGISIGSKLQIDAKYYRRAVAVFLEFGSKLVQVVWRKIRPEQIEDACNTLNEQSYKLITKRQYKAAARMLKFALFEIPKQGSDAVRKTMVVNYANAEKLDGNTNEAIRILNGEDWSASTEKYKICVAAIKDDVDEVVSMMKRVVDAGELSIACFRSWPVFEKLRSDAKFVEVFEKTFGTKIISDRGFENPKSLNASESDGQVPEQSNEPESLSDFTTLH